MVVIMSYYLRAKGVNMILVKVAMRGHVGVHGGLSHWDHPQELSFVFVIQDSYYHTLGSGNSTPLDLLANLIFVQELQIVSGVCR